jgi:hypothetical protein
MHTSATIPPAFDYSDIPLSHSPHSFYGVVDDEVATVEARGARVESDLYNGPVCGSPVSGHAIRQLSSPQLNGQSGAESVQRSDMHSHAEQPSNPAWLSQGRCDVARCAFSSARLSNRDWPGTPFDMVAKHSDGYTRLTVLGTNIDPSSVSFAPRWLQRRRRRTSPYLGH